MATSVRKGKPDFHPRNVGDRYLETVFTRCQILFLGRGASLCWAHHRIWWRHRAIDITWTFICAGKQDYPAAGVLMALKSSSSHSPNASRKKPFVFCRSQN